MLYYELLEERALLTSGWHNAALDCDVDQSGIVDHLDVLSVINDLNRDGYRSLNLRSPQAGTLVDVNNDGFLDMSDIDRVLEVLRQYSAPLDIESSVLEDMDRNGVVIKDRVTIHGVTLPLSRVTLKLDQVRFHTTMASVHGEFEFASVELSRGDTQLLLEAVDARGRTADKQSVLTQSDFIVNWNATLLELIRNWRSLPSPSPSPSTSGRIATSPPPVAAKNLAMVHTAMLDALNIVDGQYKTYLDALPSTVVDVSTQAAAIAAAYTVATALYNAPDELIRLEATLHESKPSDLSDEAWQRSFSVGQYVGERMLSNRIGDGSEIVATYRETNEPGRWRPTSPDFLPAALPQWSDVKPFVINAATDHPSLPPPALTSEAYAQAVDQVMRLGALQSAERTVEQTNIAKFWAGGAGTATPPGQWNRIAQTAVTAKPMSVWDTARLFAMLNMSMADAAIVAWNTKYEFDLWRPIDAITQAASDGNEFTTGVPTWQPLLATPNHPSYVSGHSTFSSAASTVLTSLLGDSYSFSITIDPGHVLNDEEAVDVSLTKRSFASFAEAAAEAGASRIYGGIHFAFDNGEGLRLGAEVAQFVMGNALQPR